MAERNNLDLMSEIAIQVDAQIAKMFARMRKANEQMGRDRIDIERLKQETAVIKADI
jgi:hypothetical protein